tara:strand:+ start:272 stop:1831 length:1560 start_codon:yes stop_codon:yes gene_type:complete
MATKDLLIKVNVAGAKKAEKQVKGIDGSLNKLGSMALKVSGAFFAAKGIISGFQRVIDLSSEFDVVSRGFANLSRDIGGSVDTLNKLQIATDGTVSSIDLMTQANNAMLLGIFKNNDQMAEMFDVAQRLGSALGKDTLFGVESLVTGMGRQSKLMLDNLGIMVDIDEANKRFAQSLGKSTKELTDQEKKQAFNNETMRQAKILVDGLGEEQLTTNDVVAKLSSSFDDLGVSIGNKLSPLVKFLASDFISLTESVNDFIGPEPLSRQEQLNTLLSQRNKLVGEENEKRKEAVFVADLFTDKQMEARSIEKDTIDAGAEAIDNQIKQFHDLIFTKEKVKLQIKEVADAEINTGAVIKKVNVDHTFMLQQLQNQKKKGIQEDIRGAIISGQSAEEAMRSVVRAELMEAISGLVSSILKSFPFPVNLAIAAGAGALATSALERNLASASKLKFADGGIVPGFGSQDTVPAMLTPGEVILNQAQQENLVRGMGVTVNIQGNVFGTREFVRDTLVPEIERAVRFA